MSNRRLSIAELLNPVVDENERDTLPQPSSASLTPPLVFSSIPTCREPQTETNVYLNRKTTLSTLYTFEDPAAYVEYPSTHPTQPVGYKFRQCTSTWQNPISNFAYSLGRPSGCTKPGEEVFCKVLLDDDLSMVPCTKKHYTCQGSKICPMANHASLSQPHLSVQPKDIQLRFAQERQYRLSLANPTHDVFVKTLAYVSALQKIGCRAPRCEETTRNLVGETAYTALLEHHAKASRGYTFPEFCQGRLCLEYDQQDKPLIRCEHYSLRGNRDHLIQYIDDSYDTEYLDAYFNEDAEELDRIEYDAQMRGYGPKAECSVVVNISSQRTCCPYSHRSTSNDNTTTSLLQQPNLLHLPCSATFQVYEPLPEYRVACPWALVVCRGSHFHPIPIPQKTPHPIRLELDALLESLGVDLPDLTARRLLRHPVLVSFLRSRIPSIQRPTLADFHISLANRSHVKYYIDRIKEKMFPQGTGWKGVHHLKACQDKYLPRSEHYIRCLLEYPSNNLEVHDEDISDDIDETRNQSDCLQIVVCMSEESSRRMLSAKYLQSDIGFKRVVGFYEFEIVSLDRLANSSITYCRVFLNRQSAVAHEKVFSAIEKVVLSDTGKTLQWRHIHAESLEESATDGMILQWTGDQHGGQAKGLGLHLQKVAQQFPSKRDLYDQNRLLTSLTPYEHLRRLFRLCYVHSMRNIQKVSAPDTLKNVMRSLLCMEHNNWDGAIAYIRNSSNKAAVDWVNDKIRSEFAFPAMCWEKSLIPREVWKAGERDSNLVESCHSDVNREGVHCTLVGGIKKGQDFDGLKLKTIAALELGGVQTSYSSGHIVVNATKNLKRKLIAHHQMLEGQDSKIEQHNKRLLAANKRLQTSRDRVNQVSERRAEQAFEKQVEAGKALVGTGSGKVGIYLPGSCNPK